MQSLYIVCCPRVSAFDWPNEWPIICLAFANASTCAQSWFTNFKVRPCSDKTKRSVKKRYLGNVDSFLCLADRLFEDMRKFIFIEHWYLTSRNGGSDNMIVSRKNDTTTFEGVIIVLRLEPKTKCMLIAVRSSPKWSLVCSGVHQIDEMLHLIWLLHLKYSKTGRRLVYDCVKSWCKDFWVRSCFRKTEEARCRKAIPRTRWSCSFPWWKTIWR